MIQCTVVFECTYLIRGEYLTYRCYKMYFLSVLILAVFASTTSALPPCVCTRDLKPVCGSDGVTYNNQCLLDCARTRKPELELARSGRCTSPDNMCICPLIHSPVCGSDGKNYPNECSLNCQARFKDLRMVHAGDCVRAKRDAVLVAKLEKCDCNEETKPVCGSDGNTYPNECTLNCATEVSKGLHMESEGACIEKDVPVIHHSGKSCPCPKNRKPVCGSDGVTYSNECLMRCAGDLTVVRRGPCGDISVLRTVE